MEAEKAIIDLLLADSAVVALVGSRIYLVEAIRSAPVPYVVVYRMGGKRIHSLTGPSGLANATIRTDIYSRSTKDTRLVSAAMRAVIDGYRGIVSGVDLQSVLFDDEQDAYEETPEFRVLTQSYKVWYREG